MVKCGLSATKAESSISVFLRIFSDGDAPRRVCKPIFFAARPLAGGFCALFSCAALRSRTWGGVLRRLLCGRQSFSAPCPCRAAEFLPIIAHRRQKGKAICRQNLFRPKTPPSAHKPHPIFSQKGARFIQNVQAKNISDPPRPSAAGGAGHSAPSTLVVACACALRRGVRTSTCSACKMRLFLHIFPMQGIKLPSTGQTIGEDPNGCAAELHMMI